ncbi:MAG TPA: type II secretion system minor pseudopilin GspK [Myxococcales bacterium]
MRSAPVQHRGVALILVLTTIAILTAIGVDFSYSSRVSLKLAENLRDETRAEYLARSAVNVSRLLLHFQKQVDQLGGQLGAALGGLTGGPRPPPRPGAGPAAPAPNNLGIRLWQVVPIESNAFSALLSGRIEGLDGIRTDAAALPARPGERASVTHAFGGFDGSFQAKIVDENSRINVQRLDDLGARAVSTLTQLRAMMADPKYDFIFDEEDANRDRVRRDDVLLAMKDWIDIDETGTAFDPSNPQRPFVNGFGDENSAYSRYEPRYKAKNGRFDSLEELYMVRGVNDRFMAAFGDRLTIWPDINTNLNINTDDPQQMLTNILIAAANPNDPSLRDPRLLKTILQEIQLRKMFSFFGMSADDFVSILVNNRIQLRPEIDTRQGGKPSNLFGSTSDTFRITATGRVGRIEKQVTAVVRYDDALGKMLYWKED